MTTDKTDLINLATFDFATKGRAERWIASRPNPDDFRVVSPTETHRWVALSRLYKGE